MFANKHNNKLTQGFKFPSMPELKSYDNLNKYI